MERDFIQERGEMELGRVEGGETIVRVYCVREESVLNK